MWFIKIPLSCIIYCVAPLLKAFQRLPFPFCQVHDAWHDLAPPCLSKLTLCHSLPCFPLSSQVSLHSLFRRAKYLPIPGPDGCKHLYLGTSTSHPSRSPLLFLYPVARSPASQYFSFMVHIHNHNQFIIGVLSFH